MADADRAEIAKLEALYAEHPEGRVFTHLAEAYRKAGELDRAREVLAEGIERHPDYSSAHVVQGRVLMDQGHRREAESEFQRVLELDSHNLVALRALGDIARAEGRRDEAMAYYHRLLELEPTDEAVRAAVAGMRSEAVVAEEPEEPEEAADWGFVDAVDYGTEGGDSLGPGPEAAGIAEEAEGSADEPPAEWTTDEPDEPAGAGTEITSGEPEMATATIAEVYARQGLYDRAADVYRQLLRERPDDASLRAKLEDMEAREAEAQGAGAQVGAVEESWNLDEDPVGAGAGGELEGLESSEFRAADADIAPLEGLETDEVDPETGLVAESLEGPEPEPLSGATSQDVPPPPAVAEDWPWPPDPTGESEPSYESEPVEPVQSEPVAESEPGPGALQPGAEPEPEAVESVWTGAAGASSQDESPYAWAEGGDEPVDESPPIGEYFRSLLEWSPGAGESAPGGTAGAGVPSAPEPADVEAPDAEGLPRRGTPEAGSSRSGTPEAEAPPGETPGEAPPPPEADDDDLDTFRSWLESLKE